MYAVQLMRQRDERIEEYGRVLLEGQTITFEGLSAVFQAYLQRGIQDDQQRLVTPGEGMAFLKNLKYHHFDAPVFATEVRELD